jgi:hypothetical protein
MPDVCSHPLASLFGYRFSSFDGLSACRFCIRSSSSQPLPSLTMPAATHTLTRRAGR